MVILYSTNPSRASDWLIQYLVLCQMQMRLYAEIYKSGYITIIEFTEWRHNKEDYSQSLVKQFCGK